MSFINVFVSNPAYINVKNNQLILRGKKEMSFPLEEINSVMIESLETNLSSYALSKIAQYKGVVFICDEKHLPHAVLLPYNSFCRRLKILRLQLDVKKPVKKNIWKSIITAKIRNQAECLRLSSLHHQDIYDISERVLSGDSTHCEAEAAAKYFRVLFGNDYTRGKDDIINSALNYGYAILRGFIARTVVAHGLEPNFGVFHCSELNEFNLADDFIEPFRPVVDLFVRQCDFSDLTALDSELKMHLLNLINCDVLIDDEKHPLTYAIEKVVSSYILCLKYDSAESLILPQILPYKVHRYE